MIMNRNVKKHKVEQSASTENHSEKKNNSAKNPECHEIKIHQYTSETNQKYFCEICKYSCTTSTDLFQHSIIEHSECKNTQLVFESVEEFENWKNQTENETTSSYVFESCNTENGLIKKENKDGKNTLTNKHKCDICEKSFKFPSRVLRHKKSVHKIEPPARSARSTENLGKYSCRICGKKFNGPGYRRKHERLVHQVKPELKYREYLCGLCKYLCKNRKDLVQHLINDHQGYEETKLVFESMSEFETWKCQMEEETASSYVIYKSYEIKNELIKKYSCHRSGHYRGRSKGIRRMKSKGTNKIGSFCPAHINARINKLNNNVSISYSSTHLGHSLDVNRLRLSKPEKDEIAGQLYAGVPVPLILSKISETASPTKRLAVTTAQDIQNVSASYGLNSGNLSAADNNWESGHASSEMEEIPNEHVQNFNGSKLKEETIAVLMSFLPIIENFKSEDQFKKLKKSLTILMYKCLNSNKKL